MYNFELKALHVPGEANFISDRPSRWHADPSYQQEFFELAYTRYSELTECFIISMIYLSLHRGSFSHTFILILASADLLHDLPSRISKFQLTGFQKPPREISNLSLSPTSPFVKPTNFALFLPRQIRGGGIMTLHDYGYLPPELLRSYPVSK